jgi:Intracellular proteinase inhibitor
MTRSLLSVLLLAAALAYACGPRARSAEPERRVSVNGPPVDARLDVTVGTAVAFAFHVTNNEGRKLELRFPSGQTHEIVVTDAIGREVWRWSAGRMFTQSLQNRILESNATLTWEASWDGDDGRLAPGDYVAVASLLSQNKPLEQRAEFSVR